MRLSYSDGCAHTRIHSCPEPDTINVAHRKRAARKVHRWYPRTIPCRSGELGFPCHGDGHRRATREPTRTGRAVRAALAPIPPGHNGTTR
jgi:hypothetical protein